MPHDRVKPPVEEVTEQHRVRPYEHEQVTVAHVHALAEIEQHVHLQAQGLDHGVRATNGGEKPSATGSASMGNVGQSTVALTASDGVAFCFASS